MVTNVTKNCSADYANDIIGPFFCRNQYVLEKLQESHANQVKEFKREITSLESKLSMEKAATDAEKRRNHAISEQQQHGFVEDEPRLSPTSSIGRDSVGSLSSVWPAVNINMMLHDILMR